MVFARHGVSASGDNWRKPQELRRLSDKELGENTHAPLSTLNERTLSKPNSMTLQHSEVNSW